MQKPFFCFDNGTGIFGSSTSLTSKITNRIGVTQISQQFYSVTKVLYGINGKQDANYVNNIKASKIYDDYHQINEITNNSFKIYSDVPLRMKSTEFVSLINNNFAYINGKLCELLTINFVDEQSLATISYKEPDNYATGKVNIIVINS